MAFPTKFKPETLARHARERAAARVERDQNLWRRLAEAVAERPGNSLYTDLLREHEERMKAEGVPTP